MRCRRRRRLAVIEQAEARRAGARHAGEPAAGEAGDDSEHIGDGRRSGDGGRFEVIALGREPFEQGFALLWERRRLASGGGTPPLLESPTLARPA
jgi:hypothetical protein